MIRVVVADDHPVFRRGLRGVLEEADDVTVVGEAADGATAVRVAVDQDADVVLMDLHMDGPDGPDGSDGSDGVAGVARVAGVDGIAATALLLSERPLASVVVLTMSADDASVRAALRAGARGYVVKGASGEAILAAVRSVAAGDTVLGGEIAGALLTRVTAPLTRTGPFPDLTDREEEVLDLVARGWSNADIARHLVVSDKTVRNHVSNLFAKLGVPDRARAIVLARERGLGERR